MCTESHGRSPPALGIAWPPAQVFAWPLEIAWPRAPSHRIAWPSLHRKQLPASNPIHYASTGDSEPGTAWPNGFRMALREISGERHPKTIWQGSAWIRIWSARGPGDRFLLTIPECMHISSRCKAGICAEMWLLAVGLFLHAGTAKEKRGRKFLLFFIAIDGLVTAQHSHRLLVSPEICRVLE